MEPYTESKKTFKLVRRCHQLLSGFVRKGHLPRVSRQSANDKDDNEMNRWHCKDILAFTLWQRETQKSQLEYLMMMTAISHRLKWGLLPTNEVGRIAQHLKGREGSKDQHKILMLYAYMVLRLLPTGKIIFCVEDLINTQSIKYTL